ncbi:MAG TPA: hypothetical protein VG603_04040 [Chitinophagales bacterium]|nr:hypothetical protein [Chitinophagales bacterium]
MARIYYGLVIIYLMYRYSTHVLLSQLQIPVLNYVNTDFTYIAFFYTGISTFLAQHHYAALAFDLLLGGTTLAAFLFPSARVLPVLFTFLLGVYEVVGYTFLCFHKHNLTGVWWCSLMFWVVDERGFTPLFYLTRYYCLFTYASAGFWKFYRHIWHLPGHFPVILKSDGLAYLVEHTDGWRTALISWLIVHPDLMNITMTVTCFIQLSFLIGFFTRRLDWFFFLYAIIFHILSFFLLQAYFLEFSVILITLIPVPILYKVKSDRP